MIDKARITRRVNLSSLVKRLVVVSTTALLVSGLIWPIPTAEAQTGSISGHVYDDAGDPISGAEVWADPYAGGEGQPPTTTDPEGNYTITGLGSGDYKVGARAPNHAEEFYDDQFDYGQAARVTVNDTYTTPDIDFALDPGGTISGTVDSGGTPRENIDVGASTDWGGTGARTDSSGNYTIHGVPYGQYKVSAGGGGSGYLRQFWQNRSNSDEADLVTVDATPSPTAINFSLEPGGTIRGTVKDPSGGAVQNAWASAHNQDWTFNEGSNTDATGVFSITAPVGTYVLEVNPPQGSLWAAPNPQTVTLASIDTPENVGTVYLTSPVLTGKVTAPDGTPIRDAWVEAYTENWSVGSNTDDQGIFRIGGLSSGTYTLHANPPQ